MANYLKEEKEEFFFTKVLKKYDLDSHEKANKAINFIIEDLAENQQDDDELEKLYILLAYINEWYQHYNSKENN